MSLPSLSDAINAVKKAVGQGSDPSAANTINEAYIQNFINNGLGSYWDIKGSDWSEVYGYQFVVTVGQKKGLFTGKGKEWLFTLPIPPQSYSVKPVMASRATPTIGGVVEETSGVTFWNIQMQGTTGISSSRKDDDLFTKAQMASSFRDNITTTGLLSGISANLNKTISKLGGIADKAIDTFGRVSDSLSSGGNPLNAVSDLAAGFVGAANTALLPPLPYSSSAVNQTSNGFTEAHELQRFFYMYSKLKGANPNTFGMKFRCYKTDQEWQVVIKDFSLQISAQNPNLYKYSIVLQGWDCAKVSETNRVKNDRFGPNGDLGSVNVITANVAKKVNLVGTNAGLRKLFKTI